MSYGAKSYKKTSIKTASPEKLLLMLYEGAIKNAKLARKAMIDGDIKQKCLFIGKTHDIVMELNNTLDPTKDQEIAAQLESLYNFCTSELLEANMGNDPKRIDSVVKVLSTLYEGWVAAVNQIRNKTEE
ncbi:flagellar export chaperone FliS [bacterium]|nr:flagellar export chaperone FliS [bacterium]